MNYEERLNKAVDYAIETHYDIWNRQLHFTFKIKICPTIYNYVPKCYTKYDKIANIIQGGIYMKKGDIIDLIRYHAEENDIGFRNVAYRLADDFYKNGDATLSEYIMALLSDYNVLTPQDYAEEYKSEYLEKLSGREDMLFLPNVIMQDLYGIVHAVAHNVGVHKFLFQGAPGTGKTEAVKQLGRILNREIYMVNFTKIVDSRLGQTQKNLAAVFREIDKFPTPDRLLIMFDEIDAIALDRTSHNDLREMGRTTSELLKLLERMNENVVLVATTNLFSYFDKALIRRFDSVIDFNRYSEEDLLSVAEKFLDVYLRKMKMQNRDIRLFRKILRLGHPIPYPGDLKNIIKSALAFSDPDNPNDYFQRLYAAVCYHDAKELTSLKNQGFTTREIEKLTNTSKSTVSRKLNQGGDSNA